MLSFLIMIVFIAFLHVVSLDIAHEHLFVGEPVHVDEGIIVDLPAFGSFMSAAFDQLAQGLVGGGAWMRSHAPSQHAIIFFFEK